MPEYELREYLEAIQDRAVDDLAAALPSEGDSTSDEGYNAKTENANDASDSAGHTSWSIMQRHSSREGNQTERSSVVPSSMDRGGSRLSLMAPEDKAERERSVTVGAE